MSNLLMLKADASIDGCGYECVHTDKALVCLFFQQFEKLLLCSSQEDAAEWYKKLNRIRDSPSKQRVKLALAKVAYIQSGGRSLATSPVEWQEKVYTDELWQLLDNGMISYEDVPPDSRLILNDEDRLLKLVDLHPNMVQFVPFWLLLAHESLLALRLMVEPSLYYKKPLEEMRLRPSIVEAFLESTQTILDDYKNDVCPWCFKYRKLPAEIREAGGLDLVSRCLQIERLQDDQGDNRATKRPRILSGVFR